jgi:hypothetical protein
MALLLSAAAWPADGAIILQLQVVEGEGSVYAAGSRATRGLTVLVTDETGNPVSGATVSFRLPEQGPGGTFPGGLRTQVVTTQPDGKASVWGMQWNKVAGSFEIRITAVKEQARAGIVSTQYLSDAQAVKSGGSGTFQASHNTRTKWLMIGAAVAAGAAAGMAFGRSPAAKTSSTTSATSTSIGSVSITIGRP